MTTTFEISIRGNDISRSRVVTYTGTLAGAKRKASAEFGAGFLHHEIVIYSGRGEYPIASRLVGEDRWTAAE